MFSQPAELIVSQRNKAGCGRDGKPLFVELLNVRIRDVIQRLLQNAGQHGAGFSDRHPKLQSLERAIGLDQLNPHLLELVVQAGVDIQQQIGFARHDQIDGIFHRVDENQFHSRVLP